MRPSVKMAGFVSFIVASLVGFGNLCQIDDHPVKEYVDRYSDENGVTIEVLGVCEITANRLIAWDTKGYRNETLSNQIAKYLEKQQYPDLPFQFEHKNRYVAIRRTSPYGVSLSFQGADSANLISQTQGYGLPEDSLSLIPAYASKNQKDTSVWATVPDGKVQILEFSPKNKQTKKLPSGNVTLEAIKPLGFNDLDGIEESYIVRFSMLEINNRAWGIYFRMPAQPAGQQTAFVINQKGPDPILIVDVNGNPLDISYTDLKPVPYDPVYHVPADRKSFAAGAATFVLRQSSTSPLVATNINPANIKNIQMVTMATKKIALVHIPLDVVSD